MRSFIGKRRVNGYGSVYLYGNHYQIEGVDITPDTVISIYQTADNLVGEYNGKDFILSILEPTTFGSTVQGSVHA